MENKLLRLSRYGTLLTSLPALSAGVSSGLSGCISAQCDVPFMKMDINPSGRSFKTLRACQGSIVPGSNRIKMVFHQMLIGNFWSQNPFEGFVFHR